MERRARRLGSFIGLATLTLLLSACGVSEVSQTFYPERCEALRLSGPVQARLVSSIDPAQAANGQSGLSSAVLTITGSQAALSNVEFEDEGPRLILLSRGDEALQVSVFCPMLDDLELLGAAQLTVAPELKRIPNRLALYGSSSMAAGTILADDLDIRASGQAQVALHALSSESVQLLASGQSAVALSGETANMRVDLTGETKVAARELRAQWVDVKASGKVELVVQAGAHLAGVVSGDANLAYQGQPDLSIEAQDQAVIRQL